MSEWKKFENMIRLPEVKCYQKRFDTPTPCQCNGGPGKYVEKYVSWRGLEMEIRGQTKQGPWIRLTGYAFDSEEEAEAYIPRLLDAWETLNK